MIKTDPFALKLAKIEAEKAKALNPEADKPKKPQRPPLSEFVFPPTSAQVSIKHMLGDWLQIRLKPLCGLGKNIF